MTGKSKEEQEKKLTHKDISIQRLTNLLNTQANYVMKNDTLDPYDKADELDVILSLIRFLDSYDENCQVLNMYLQEKKFDQAFRASIERKFDEYGNDITDYKGDERE